MLTHTDLIHWKNWSDDGYDIGEAVAKDLVSDCLQYRAALAERDRLVAELRERIADLETHLTLAMTEKHDAESEAEQLRQDLDDALHDHSVTLTHLNDPREPDVLAPTH